MFTFCSTVQRLPLIPLCWKSRVWVDFEIDSVLSRVWVDFEIESVLIVSFFTSVVGQEKETKTFYIEI